ncbi:MarR family winged helix-turn-helix transcriptional regulator [Agrococcus sp. SGAir0287]|uniref:MarR family winged helix-turn-helix transcriptional regulator n=1 Tax=Agrococcus sp. SGAir0287 TaxID=2070347 RepID=UPI0010CCF287|nr:MarR family transcriptional regulator [Agrococcus sp. SGAir0287]QCR20846.1 MarR family transcriptional regulator [Agrococcus sp. SGAir0287]
MTAASEAWRTYFEGSAMLAAALERRLKDACGLDLADFNILLLLSEADGERMRMGTLARQLAFAPGRLTYRMQQLEAKGWVQREASPADRRGTDAVLTEDGRRTLRRARPMHARHVEELFLSRISDAEAAQLEGIFAPVRSTLLGECETAQIPDDD